MKKHLVKKSPDFVDAGFVRKKPGPVAYCETRVNGKPTAHRMSVGDTLYVAEIGYAIFAQGTITKVNPIIEIKSLQELFEYFSNSKIKSTKYWFEVANSKIHNNKKFRYLSVLEYEADLKLLDCPVFLPKEFRNQASWQTLDDNYEFEQTSQAVELSPNIPAALRVRLFNTLNKGFDEYMIDVDHFVPKSLGGPGNIEENLELLGAMLNRRKRDSVPKGLFVVGKEFLIRSRVKMEIPAEFLSGTNDLFFTSSRAKDLATRLISEVHQQLDIDGIRAFYKAVKGFHRTRSEGTA